MFDLGMINGLLCEQCLKAAKHVGKALFKPCTYCKSQICFKKYDGKGRKHKKTREQYNSYETWDANRTEKLRYAQDHAEAVAKGTVTGILSGITDLREVPNEKKRVAGFAKR